MKILPILNRMKINPNDMVLLTSGQTVRVTSQSVEGGKFQGKAIIGDPAMPPLDYSVSDVFATFKFTGHHNTLLQQMIDQEQGSKMFENVFISASSPESGGGIFVISFKSSSAMAEPELMSAMKNAVTRWMMQTFEGGQAWRLAEGRFFIEHLAPFLEDRHLSILLSSFGVNELRIVPVAHDHYFPADQLIPDEDALSPTPPDQPEASPAALPVTDSVETEEEIENLSWSSGRPPEEGKSNG